MGDSDLDAIRAQRLAEMQGNRVSKVGDRLVAG